MADHSVLGVNPSLFIVRLLSTALIWFHEPDHALGGGVQAQTPNPAFVGGEPRSESAMRVDYINRILDNATSIFRPTEFEGNVTEVTCAIYINSFDSISVDNMDFSIDVYMRQQWVDPRLDYTSFWNVTKVSLDSKLMDRVWVPDMFFPNEKQGSGHLVTVPNKLIRIYQNGTVLYSARYSLRLSCQMPLYHFPLDMQTCYIRMESYGHTTDELLFVWRYADAVQINENLTLPQFNLTGHSWGNCSASYLIGNFTCLEVKLTLARQYGYYIIQNYIPSFLIVALSWVSFWINIDAVPARISLGVLTVLTMTTQSVGVWMSLPRVSYIKAIDVWMSTTVLFVFVAMLEFAIVNTLARKEIRRMSMRFNNSHSNRGLDNKDIPSDAIKRMMDEYTYGLKQDETSRNLARKVDKVSRKIFPTSFIAFNVAYWCYYLIKQ